MTLISKRELRKNTNIILCVAHIVYKKTAKTIILKKEEIFGESYRPSNKR